MRGDWWATFGQKLKNFCYDHQFIVTDYAAQLWVTQQFIIVKIYSF